MQQGDTGGGQLGGRLNDGILNTLDQTDRPVTDVDRRIAATLSSYWPDPGRRVACGLRAA